MRIGAPNTLLTRALLPVVALLIVASGSAALSAPAPNVVGPICGNTSGHQVCITLPSTTLSGPVPVTMTTSGNKGQFIVNWVPDSGPSTYLMWIFGASGVPKDYSFTWPTQKFPDGSGTLQVVFSKKGSPVVTPELTLSNGGFQPEPNDWQNYLPPATFTGSTDPIVAAVGDGADDRPSTDKFAKSLVKQKPPLNLFLYLGDVYEKGSYAEMMDHYGQFGTKKGTGTLWGQLAYETQPTIGNHESLIDPYMWQDYWHQRPLWTKFTFGNVLFVDLDSSEPMDSTSQQYADVQSWLSQPGLPPCIVAEYHIPAVDNGGVNPNSSDMWSLLATHGVDLVLNGHDHGLAEYPALDQNFQPAQPGGPSMVELIDGAGGHDTVHYIDPNAEWVAPYKELGFLKLTLNGAANGGTPTSLSWDFRSYDGNTILHQGSTSC